MNVRRLPAHVMTMLLVMATSLPLGCRGQVQVPPPPHIILITADTLRADHLGAYGYQRPTSPNIDRLATQSTLFSNAVTVIPKTGPSFTTMFSGRYPAEHRVRSNTVGIPADLPVIAERLAAAGYRTAGFVSNPVLRSATGYGRGFATYKFYGGTTAMQSVTDAFGRWAEQPWEQPSFVWIHYIDPHGPYRPPPAYERMFLEDSLGTSERRVALSPQPGRFTNPNKILGAIPKYQRHGDEDRVETYIARYDAEIRGMDEQVGRVIEILRQHNLFDRSLVVFSSDHGESLGEHNFYFEHGWFAYEATLHVPLLIKPPGISHHATVSEQVSTLDLLPTLLAAALAANETEAPGANILHTVRQHRAVLIENSNAYPHKYVGIRTSGWKYLRRLSDRYEELYNLTEDPTETHNLTNKNPAMLAELASRYERMAASLRIMQPLKPTPHTEEIDRQLRSLGYIE